MYTGTSTKHLHTCRAQKKAKSIYKNVHKCQVYVHFCILISIDYPYKLVQVQNTHVHAERKRR